MMESAVGTPPLLVRAGATNALAIDASGNTTISGNLTVTGTVTATITPTPAGANTQVQYNNSGAMGASPNFTFNQATNTLGVGGPLNVSGAATLSSTLGVTGATTLSSTLNVVGTISGNGKQIFNTGDTYLRINETGAFTGGTWFGGTNVMIGTGGGLGVGSNGGTTNSRVWISSGTFNGTNVINLDGATGNGYFAGNVSIGTSTTRSRLDVGGGIDLAYAGSSLASLSSGIRWQNGSTVTTAFGFIVNGGVYFQGDNSALNSNFGVRAPTVDGSAGSVVFYVQPSGNTYAPAFFDTNNAAFYVDPNSVSIFNDIRPSIMYDRDDTGYFVNPNGQSNMWDVRGAIFYDIQNTGFYVDPNNVSILNDIRPSVIYDRENTGYYLDMNNTSNVNVAIANDWYANNWYRVNGGGGIYWQAYGGGWNMQDATYLRAYGNKFVLAAGYYHTSDARLKHDIKPFRTNGLSVVDGLRVVHFKWNADNKQDWGVIAQETQKVLPEAVNTDDKGFMQVQYDKLVLPVIEAVKELHAMVKDLAAKLADVLTWKDATDARLQKLEERLNKVEAEKADLAKENAALKATIEQRLQQLESKAKH